MARLQQLLAGALDWEFVLRYAEKHSLIPLLYYHLKAQASEDVPPPVFEKLRNQFRQISALNIYLSGELRRLLKQFAAHGIDAIPYKGPALAAQAYGNVARRQFCDLDILVRRRDVLRVKELLLAKGYALHPPLNEAQQAMLLRTQYHLPFTRDAHRSIVEIHWEVSASLFAAPLDVGSFWEKSRSASFEGLTINTLAPEDLLLSLCVHGAKHLWERLSWITDIAQLLEVNSEIDWLQLLAQSRRTGTDRMLLLGLRVAHELLGATMRAEVSAEFAADDDVAQLARQVYSQLFAEEEKASGLSVYFHFQFKARRRRRDKFNYCLHALSPTDADLSLWQLPASLSFVYYLLRPLRMLLTGGPSHLQH